MRGKNITHQQKWILDCVEKAVNGAINPATGKPYPKRISIASGHGIGKSQIIAQIIIWFLFCHRLSQCACTAPTKYQIKDVLRGRVQLQLSKMPKHLAELFEYTSDYLRVKDNPENRYAVAKTSSKENPEALAGMHAPHILIVADEASGVEEAIFKSLEGSLTEADNALVILISNPTRNMGYFYDSHHKNKESWQTLQLSSVDSPIVEEGYVEGYREREGEDSDEYRIRVL